ncbi:hypothetical protein SAMD00019534_008430 [Acytostelium subglobosum LB1]|uniref:hypothetical protein n=1 Tax=Acytostelium subglobosum LB1 TaxID=1410327 RepID=UPI0006449921|nr:hypothetical protein SAMD00019534_008430 [Acytostelium subglobosum LB1]GAM17668.1 hypothetical protein SAMD00019534_008430 [Acytostelium subglobosum LB1]|eukprot:XP_012758264.1 hypothetical protein SAMD00019534_008430 [Acytostelium subglobosum LB1]
MFAKGSSLVVKDVLSTTLRLTQRRGSAELQKGESASINPFNETDIPTIMENGQQFVDLHSRSNTPREAFQAHKRRSSFSDRMVNPQQRRYSMEIEVSSIKDILNLEVKPSSNHLRDFKPITEEKSILEIESERTFELVWNQLATKYGVENLSFPKNITFLLGGPGAGKGTNTRTLQDTLGVQSEPIVVSSLLNSPVCQAIKKSGGLVNDKVVLELMLERLGKPDFMGNKPKSVIVDGFPRNEKQVKFVELLYDKLSTLRRRVNPNATLPKFRITVLHVSEEESLSRQLHRGHEAVRENMERKMHNMPEIEVRNTDTDPEACKKRYEIYMSEYNHLKQLSNRFQYDEIDANGSLDNVEHLIRATYSQ